jgi:acetyl-CoA C-acetyltransferase
MKDTVIVGATRSPIGTFGGSLRDITANQLSPFIIDAVIKRTGIEKSLVDHVILGCCFEGVEHNVARIGLVKAGLPVETTAHQVVATCGSGLQAIMSGIQGISDNDYSLKV